MASTSGSTTEETVTSTRGSTRTTEEKFVKIQNLLFAGIGTTNDPCTFYRRQAFQNLTDFVGEIVRGNHIGLVGGLPGTGKSSTIWWALLQPEYQSKNIAWIHLNRSGEVTAFVKIVPAEGEEKPKVEIQALLKLENVENSIKADILVLDGANHFNYGTSEGMLRRWVMGGLGSRCAFLTMSNKIKRLHAHELRILEAQQKAGTGVAQRYCTQHSWTIDEYLAAFLEGENGTSLFEEKRTIFAKEWEIRVEDEASDSQCNKRHRDGRKKMSPICDIVTQKFAYAGGSARWMMNFSTDEIDKEIDGYLTECPNTDDLLSFALGPESPLAKTHLYFSSLGKNETTLYSMVSARATILAVERHGTNGIRQMYKHAAALKNPSFLGWVIEADLFNRCRNGNLVMETKGQMEGQKEEVVFDAGTPVEFDYDYLLLLYEESEQEENGKESSAAIAEEMKRLVAGPGETQTCKPSAWNKGAYDVVFIKTSDVDGCEKNLIVRFGQVTKSDTHSLKLKFYDFFLKFLVRAGYTIDSVELGFIVPSKQDDTFRITAGKVEGSGLLNPYTRFGTPPTDNPTQKQENCFAKSREHDQIQVYGLNMTSMDYPDGI
mmetsp:Transcript_31340/g.73538  ORF Transcript_31340/g.73538 Transcript_31340/m.73538 type:complete len:603 (-) Transcript_31340:170-1978(-)